MNISSSIVYDVYTSSKQENRHNGRSKMGITARNENYYFLRKKQFGTVFNNQTTYMYIQQTGAKVYLENKCWSKVDSCKAGESIGRIKKRKKEREKKRKEM